MLIFWRKKMVEYRNNRTPETDNQTENDYNNLRGYDCECCHCKKIFMLLVLLILVFMAGIMVGNCGRCRYADNYYNKHYGYNFNNPQFAKQNPQIPSKKFHRGMQQVAPVPAAPTQDPRNYQPQPQPFPNGQLGGFIIEVDQAD